MAQTKYQKAALKAFFDLGINVDKYIDQAIRSGAGNVDQVAYALIIRSPEFRARFPGIFRANGTLRMTPQEYIQREDTFRSVAAQHGFALSKSSIGNLVKNNVSGEGFALRARGIQLAQTRPDIVASLNSQIDRANRYRAKHNQPLIKRIGSTKDAVNFFTGQADQTLYAIYEGAQFEAVQRSLGLETASASQLARGTAGVLSLEQIEEGYMEIASRLRKAAPELKGFGITQKELEILEFGGANRSAIAQKAEQALKQRDAALQGTVATQRTGIRQGRPVIESAVSAGY